MEDAGALANARAVERVVNALDLAADTPDGFPLKYWDNNIRQDAEEGSLFREFSRAAAWKANEVNCAASRRHQLESRLKASDENAKKCRDCQDCNDKSPQLVKKMKLIGAGRDEQTLPEAEIQRRCRYHEDERNCLTSDLRGGNWNWVFWAYGNGDLELLSILSRNLMVIRKCITLHNLGKRGSNTPIDRRHARYYLDNMYRYFRCLIRILADFPSLSQHRSGPRGAGDPVDVFRLAVCLEQRAHRCAVLLYEQCFDDLELCRHSETEEDVLRCYCEDYSNLYAAANLYMMTSQGRHVEPGLLQVQDWLKQLGHQLEVHQREAERREQMPAGGSNSYGRILSPPQQLESSHCEIAILLVQELMRSGIFPDFHQRNSPCGRARHDGIKAKLCHMLHFLSGNEIQHHLRFNKMEEILSFEIDSALLLMEGGSSGNTSSPPTLTEQDLLRRLVVENSRALTSPTALSGLSEDKRQMLDLLMGDSDSDVEHRCADYVLNQRVLPVVESIRASFAGGTGGTQEGPMYSELHDQVHMAWQGRDRGPPLAPVTASHRTAETPGALVRGLRDQVLKYSHTPNRWVEWDEVSAAGITKYVGHIKEVSSCGNWLELQYVEVHMAAAGNATAPGLFGVRSVEASRVKPFPEPIRQSQEDTLELFAEIHLLCEDIRSRDPAERGNAEDRVESVVEDTLKRIAAPMVHHLRRNALEVLEQLCMRLYLPPTDFRKIRSDLQDSSDVQRTAEGLSRLVTIFGAEGENHPKGRLGQRYTHCRCSMAVAGLPAVAVIELDCPVFSSHDLMSRTMTVCQGLWARDAHASLRAIAVSAGAAAGLAFSLRRLKLGSSTISVPIDASLEDILSLNYAILAAPASARVCFTGLGEVPIKGMWLKSINVYKDSSGVMDSWVPAEDYAKDISALLTKLQEEFSGLITSPFFDTLAEACWEDTEEAHTDPVPTPDNDRPPPQPQPQPLPRQQQPQRHPKQHQPQQQSQSRGHARQQAAAPGAPGPGVTGSHDSQHPDGGQEPSPTFLGVSLPPEIRTPGQVNEWFNGPLQTQFPDIAPREFGHFGNKTHMWRTCCRLCCAGKPEDPPHLRNPPNLTKGRALKIVHSAMGRDLCPPEHILVKDAFRSVAIALTLMARVAVTPMRAWRFFERSSNQLICQSEEFSRFLAEKAINWPPYPPQFSVQEPPPNPRPPHHDNIHDQQREEARSLAAARAAFKRRLDEEEERLRQKPRSE